MLTGASHARVADRPEAHQPGTGAGQGGSRNRPEGVLPQRRVGHSQRASGKAREVLPLLRRTLPR